MKNLFQILTVSVVFLFPCAAFATTTLQEVFKTAGVLINQLTPIIVALALVAFFWGLAMYLFGVGGGSASPAAYGAPATSSKRDGRSIMIWGVIVFFVIVSIWGLVNVLQGTFKIYGGTIVPPAISNPYPDVKDSH